MTWFKIIPNDADLQASPSYFSYIIPPVKRKLGIDNLVENVEPGEIVYSRLEGKIINRYYTGTNQEETDNDSYLVVYEDLTNDTYFVPVKSKVVNNILYFEAEEAIPKNTSTSKYYSVYYGMSNIKYIESVVYEGATPYQQISDEEISEAGDGDYFDLATPNISNYYYQADSESQKIYKLAFYNDGVDWVNNNSINIGAKVFGIFDGPTIKIYGSKGSSFGKFRIRIFSYDENSTIKNTPVVDWTIIDCYSADQSENIVIYEKLDLEYVRYIFEIEALADKNVMSTAQTVNVSYYRFFPNYGIKYEGEQLNPEIAFVTVGGIR